VIINILANAAAWLHRERHARAGVALRYNRIAVAGVIALYGTRGRTDADQLQLGELVVGAVIDDWILRAEDFIIAGSFVPPVARDTITEIATNKVWEVLELPGEPVWRYSDQYRNAVRVHVKELSQ
jgi:hypothetical protein